MNKTSHNPALDMIRIFALLCVICAHFFVQTDFYYVYITGSRMYLMVLIRTLCMSCIGLFLMLSGYLLLNKQPNRAYYSKLGKTLGIYVLASGCCYLYAQFLAPEAPGTASFVDFILQTLSFRAAPYSWYIEMYLGLFLLAPYLNMIFRNLQTEKARRQLILVLVILTALPGMLNRFHYDGSWSYIGTTHIPDQLFPEYWHEFYPVTYYFLGAYLREHPLKLKSRSAFMLALAVFVCNGTIEYLLCGGNYFTLNSRQEHEPLSILIQAVLIFHCFAGRDYSRMQPRICTLLSRISDTSLGAFLVSWIFDSAFYPILRQIQPVFAYQILYLPLIIFAVFICSVLLSTVIGRIYRLSVLAVSKILHR